MRQSTVPRSILTGLAIAYAANAGSVLDIDPVHQESPVWCWAAVGEMVFSYFGVQNINPAGNFQCGIVSLVHPVCNTNCALCNVPAGSLTVLKNMLTQYPVVAGKVTGTKTDISVRTRNQAMSFSELKREIDFGRPVIAGISPNGYRPSWAPSQHVVFIVGYDEEEIIVNDPFPYLSTFFAGDPYLVNGGSCDQAGQYRMDYKSFVKRMRWKETVYAIKCSGEDCIERTPLENGASEQTAKE